MNGLDRLGMNVNEKTWRKLVMKIIMFVGRITWMNGCRNSDRAQDYVSRKQCSINETYVDGSVGAMVSKMVRGGCLPVKGKY